MQIICVHKSLELFKRDKGRAQNKVSYVGLGLIQLFNGSGQSLLNLEDREKRQLDQYIEPVHQ